MIGNAGMSPGEYWATLRKATASGANFETWTIDEMLRGFPLTPEEREQATREHEATVGQIRELRAARGAGS